MGEVLSRLLRRTSVAAVALALSLGGGLGCDGKDISDKPSQADDAGATGALERPGKLARPPKGGLPDELRPPR